MTRKKRTPAPFNSFFQATADYISLVAAMRWPGEPDKLQEQRELLEQLREKATSNPGDDWGARCFEFVRQLVYRESEPQIAELCRLRNETLRQQHARREREGGWSREERKFAFFQIYDRTTNRKAGQRLNAARKEMEAQHHVSLGKSTASEYLSERNAGDSPAPHLD